MAHLIERDRAAERIDATGVAAGWAGGSVGLRLSRRRVAAGSGGRESTGSLCRGRRCWWGIARRGRSGGSLCRCRGRGGGGCWRAESSEATGRSDADHRSLERGPGLSSGHAAGAAAGAAGGAAAGAPGAGTRGPRCGSRFRAPGWFIMSMVPLNLGAAAPLMLKPHFVQVVAVSGFFVPQFGQNKSASEERGWTAPRASDPA